MKARVIRIGNSQGILIPGRLLLAAGLRNEVELSTGHGVLMIRPVQAPRAGWAKVFQEMALNGDDAIFADIPVGLSEWDEEEWEW